MRRTVEARQGASANPPPMPSTSGALFSLGDVLSAVVSVSWAKPRQLAPLRWKPYAWRNVQWPGTSCQCGTQWPDRAQCPLSGDKLRYGGFPNPARRGMTPRTTWHTPHAPFGCQLLHGASAKIAKEVGTILGALRTWGTSREVHSGPTGCHDLHDPEGTCY